MATLKQIPIDKEFIVTVGHFQYFGRLIARMAIASVRKNAASNQKLWMVDLQDSLEHQAYDEATKFLGKKNTGVVEHKHEPKVAKTHFAETHELFTKLCEPKMLGGHLKVYHFLEKCMADKIKELSPQAHPHAKAMLEYAQDAAIHPEPWKLWLHCTDTPNASWGICTRHPEWLANRLYRRKAD